MPDIFPSRFQISPQIKSHIAALQSMLLHLDFLEELQSLRQLSLKGLYILQQTGNVMNLATDQNFYASTKAALHAAKCK